MKLFFKTLVKGNYKKIASQFNEDLFKKMTPPGGKIYVRNFEGTKKGDKFSFTASTFGIHQDWEGLITDSGEDETQSFFVDVGKDLPAPLTSWSHRHLFEKVSENETLVIDEVEYTCSSKIFDYLSFPLWQIYFYYRSYLYKKIFG